MNDKGRIKKISPRFLLNHFTFDFYITVFCFNESEAENSDLKFAGKLVCQAG